MLRRATILAAAIALAAASPAPAAIIEVGKIAAEHAPSCPSSPCLAVSRTTGYQAKVGTERGLFVVPQNGKIVAWSITLGKPGPRQIDFFDKNLGGPASARITILKPRKKLFSVVTGQGPVQQLEPYFGTSVQFALGRALNVRKGYVVALTVPTWAPALAVGLGNDSSWRASRAKGECADTSGQTAQQALGATVQYRCLYRTARLTYSATLITTPTPPAGYLPTTERRGTQATRVAIRRDFAEPKAHPPERARSLSRSVTRVPIGSLAASVLGSANRSFASIPAVSRPAFSRAVAALPPSR